VEADACETGKAWAGCQQYCTANATFSSQANPLLNITTLSAYCDWMRDVLTGLTDVSYEVKSFATDTTRQNVAAFGVFYGTSSSTLAAAFSIVYSLKTLEESTR